jgi:hypothetical protein
VDGANNKITSATYCKRKIILRIAISFSLSYFKSKKKQKTNNTPYIEAKR